MPPARPRRWWPWVLGLAVAAVLGISGSMVMFAAWTETTAAGPEEARAAIEQEGRQVAATAIAVSGVEVMRRKSPPENNENNLPIVWPALFFVNGNGINVDEFARLRGEFNTLEAVSAEKKCSLVFQAP